METESLFKKSHLINDTYKVLLFIKKGNNAETYRVKSNNGKIYFIKIFNYSKVPRSGFANNGKILEIELLKKIKCENIASYVEDGEIIINNNRYAFLVTDFVVGETLSNLIKRDPINSLYDTKQIIIDILKGLKYIHNLSEPIIHNEITPNNIMIDISTGVMKAVIIDFGYARPFLQSTKSFSKEGLNLNYSATELFNNIYSPQTDLYSVGAIMYTLLFGLPPWFKDLSKYQSDRLNIEDIISTERKKPLVFPQVDSRIIDYTENILESIKKSLDQDSEKRFQSADDFIFAINNGELNSNGSVHDENTKVSNKKIKKVQIGKGFAAIAGMKQLKEKLQNDVIDLIENPEEYKKHNLGLPNGILLYGPPGCGKTFFAERFAEESGYNFVKIISSDLASIYIHGTQEKIGKIFKDAKENAPTILYFDELDAMVPNRDKAGSNGQSGEVNEFLSQLDNIGDSGVFVIGSTNKPDLIDTAVLRAGRLEKWFFIPPPDLEARKSMFEMYLKDRPLDFGIDYEKLSTLTENYVSSDIKLLIDEASRKTIKDKEKRITMSIIEYIIQNQKPTVSITELRKYEEIRRKIENNIDDSSERPRIGFKP